MTAATLRSLADELHMAILAAHPFHATEDGLPGVDNQVPDLSMEAARLYRTHLGDIRARAEQVPAPSLPERVTLDVITHTVDREIALSTHGGIEHTVSTILAEGPSAVLTTAFRTCPEDPDAAADYLIRCAGFAEYLDEHAARLVAGASEGRLPVAALVTTALAQVDDYLECDVADVVANVPPPPGWSGQSHWQAQVRELVAGAVRPAMRRWRTTVAALPTRPDDNCGLLHLPNGSGDYLELVRVHSTLSVSPQRLHNIGSEQVAALTEQITELGATIGFASSAEVLAAFLAASSEQIADTTPARCRQVLRRAEAALGQIVTHPLPPPCEVAAMAEHLGNTGYAPHYTPPRMDGSRSGTFWYNAQQPSTSGGWALPALTHHEGVPGHHLQIARAKLLNGLPDLQRHGSITAYNEGWALYAELLAGELGLYASPQEEIGALALRLLRAARLVLDTGIHALGWTLREATDWLCRIVPIPPEFAKAEVYRYVGAPAQALGYTSGLLEILRLRDDAQQRLGRRFDLRTFHGAILDSGSVPMGSLQRLVDDLVANT